MVSNLVVWMVDTPLLTC